MRKRQPGDKRLQPDLRDYNPKFQPMDLKIREIFSVYVGLPLSLYRVVAFAESLGQTKSGSKEPGYGH